MKQVDSLDNSANVEFLCQNYDSNSSPMKQNSKNNLESS
jgi:hypothetical protein